MVKAVEADGFICRDEAENEIQGGAGSGAVRWWGNMFSGYVWDGQE
jgi:ESCRT-II complex subunit VPS36